MTILKGKIIIIIMITRTAYTVGIFEKSPTFYKVDEWGGTTGPSGERARMGWWEGGHPH